MFIIVEGPDGAGKTTLINKLRNQFDNQHVTCNIVHFSKIDDPSKYYEIYRKAILESTPFNVTIWDRSWYSDRVYGPAMRSTIEMELEQARRLDDYITENGGGFIIYCDAPLEVLWSRCRQRGEDYIQTPEQLDMIKMLYSVEMHWSKLPVIYYNTSEGF